MGILEFPKNFNEGHDAELDTWFLMSSSVPVLSMLMVYLVFVLKVGPMLMKNFPAYRLKNLLLVYNLFQILYCTFIFSQFIYLNRIKDTLLDAECRVERTRQQQLKLYGAGWHYLMAKVVDLLDTIFFVLRKKRNQITFLHVYHHTAMVFFSWLFLKYLPGEQLVIVGLLNTFVHILMYTYYLVAAMGPQYQKYLWWKKYMTTIQLIQFILIMLYTLVLVLKDCQLSRVLTVFTGIQSLFFFYLFYSFYRNAYNDKAQNKTSKLK